MAARLTCLLLGLLSHLAAPAAAQTDVLFLGNSYTNRNSLPGLVEGLAAASGRALVRDQNTPGGNTLGAPQSNGWPHQNHPTSLAKIGAGGWDALVLQDQSTLPANPFALANYSLPAVASLAQSLAASSPSARVLLFQTWGRRDGGQFCWAGNCTPAFPDFDAMQDALTAGYAALAQSIGGEVVPVGEAWRRARAELPAVELFDPDGTHPSLAGSYLAACVFFAVLFDDSPVGLAFTGGLPAGTAGDLQAVAERIVFCGVEPSGCPAPSNSSFASGATIGVQGSVSLSEDQFTLTAGNAVPNQFGTFVFGVAGLPQALGDGFLCIGSGLLRVPPVVQSDAQGMVAQAVQLGAYPFASGPGAVQAGDTRRFQLVYRDPASPGGNTFNVSGSVDVTFCP